MSTKAEAHAFLTKLEAKLQAELPHGPSMDRDVLEIIAKSKLDDEQKHKTGREYALVNHFVFPRLHELVSGLHGFTPKTATEALLSEFYRYESELAFGTPARLKKHPFGKAMLGDRPREIMEKWRAKDGSQPLTQSCPDFALRTPFRVVFEGKYFRSESAAAAETALVSGIYEAFLYRALPVVDATKDRPAWDYEYACLVAFDASEGGLLENAWNSLAEKVRESFWDSGNIFVMIVRGSPRPEQEGSK